MTDETPPANGDGNEERTVFIPAGQPARTPASASSTSPPDPTSAPTQWSPGAVPPGDARVPTTGGFQTAFAPRQVGQGIQVGDVLNHIFEVKRFIARGGMGEVFEGANVNSDERVAIKVMLPSLAADPNVIGMFRKEARTLTRLNHEGLVSYRVLAQEPQLGVLYIVTEYIDGRNLADALGEIQPTPADMIQMLRRLAAGLRAAHALGAIHRDMSPDNVILENGELTRAKVIDFGIAKDLDPGSATIVGEGFAGKLNYVAPEQLGDFGREIGPWTDVYSLALVMLAVAMGKNVAMGGSLVDAVDKRRAGPDLSGAPAELRPLLDKMLKPNPQDRLRSMDAVLEELSALDRAEVVIEPASKTPLLIGGAVAAVAIVGAAWFALSHNGSRPPAGKGAGAGITAVANDPVSIARATIDSTLPQVACTWLNVASVERKGRQVAVALTGVAGNPSAAQSEIGHALASQKIGNASIDFENVSPITQSGCAALDAYRQVRSTDAQRLSVPQNRFEMRMQAPGSSYAGKIAANAVINIGIGDPASDFTLIGLEPSGKIDPVITSRAAFQQTLKASKDGKPIHDLGGDKYQLQLDLDHIGWSGILLLTGKGPFAKAVVAPDLGARGPDWRDTFVATAANNGWHADMVWFRSVDEVKE